MEQISEEAFDKRPEYWIAWTRDNGELEICDNETGEPMYSIGGNYEN